MKRCSPGVICPKFSKIFEPASGASLRIFKHNVLFARGQAPARDGTRSGAAGKKPEQQRADDAEQDARDDREIDGSAFISPDDIARQAAKRQMELAKHDHHRAGKHQEESGSDQEAS